MYTYIGIYLHKLRIIRLYMYIFTYIYIYDMSYELRVYELE